MSKTHPMWFTTVFAGLFVALAPGVILAASQSAVEDSAKPALSALGILEQNCGSSGCHGGSNPYRFDVREPSSLLDAKVIQPGNAAGSELIRRLEAGAMPLGGYKGQPGVKLPGEDIQLLKKWIDAGAPWSAERSDVRRPFISESEILAAIIRNLEAAPKADREFLRYFSSTNLWNASGVEQNALAASGALSKLVNHLSWQKKIVPPNAIGPAGTVMRVDLRDYGWTAQTWNRIVAAYPYRAATRDTAAQAAQVSALSGAMLPYIRADWFIANASMSPLYHEILDLPATLEGLERQLKVADSGARRFGVSNSGVSRNNRVLERRTTPHGAYWKSFDFAGNRGDQNIFRDPVYLTPDGGEIIFNLPNGLQGYFIVNAQGQRIDDAPIGIVRDRTNPEDPVIHNGRSCMGCHIHGMNGFQDEVRQALQMRSDAVFEIGRALALYPGQPELERLVDRDNSRFTGALNGTGSSVPAGSQDEPVNQAARGYERPLSLQEAAAELYIPDPEQLRRGIDGSRALQKQGFDQLLGPKGGVKRDTWEQSFGLLIRELGLAAPARLVSVPQGAKLAIALETPLDLRVVRIGDRVLFRSRGDLKVDGRVAIPRESLVLGAVTGIQSPKETALTDEIQVRLDEAQLADGTSLRLPSPVVTMKRTARGKAGRWGWPKSSGSGTESNRISVPIPGCCWSESLPVIVGSGTDRPKTQTSSDAAAFGAGTVFEARF